jgi:serine/threonine protein kinase
MQSREALESEVSLRSLLVGDASYIITVRGFHLPVGDDGIEAHGELMQPEQKADGDLEPDFPYLLVMDRASHSLYQLLGSQRVAGNNMAEIRRLMTGLLKQLLRLHNAGVLHFDIKPRNILLRPNKSVVLCDLDAAMPLCDILPSGEKVRHVRSRDGKQGSSGPFPLSLVPPHPSPSASPEDTMGRKLHGG